MFLALCHFFPYISNGEIMTNLTLSHWYEKYCYGIVLLAAPVMWYGCQLNKFNMQNSMDIQYEGHVAMTGMGRLQQSGGSACTQLPSLQAVSGRRALRSTAYLVSEERNHRQALTPPCQARPSQTAHWTHQCLLKALTRLALSYCLSNALICTVHGGRDFCAR